ncbi:MAG: hypothetical protein KGN33_14515 [Paracoccaceae bacterium]|nr:hypothetical protein [Paracoccaceae bacterium]
MPDLHTTEKQAILVVGYYRSGTSALCGSLADLGVQITSDAESNEANPKGFFESTELIKFDIRVLELMNSYWSDLSPLPDGWIDRADVQLQRDVLTEILSRQFAGAPLVAVKHPHLCRLLPLYLQAAGDAGYGVKVLHTHRSPYAVATSQATKNNMTRAHAIALWSSYITSAERNARGLPRAWVRYDDLLRAPDTTVHAALSAIGIEMTPGRSVDFISRSLNRSDSTTAEGLFRPLAQLAADIETAILDGAEADVWDALRARSTDIASFVDELGRSGNRSAPGVGQGILVSTPAGRAVQLAVASKTHPVRPADRGDAVEQARVLGLLDRAGEGGSGLPNLSILIACPKDTTAAQVRATLDSIARNWCQPAVKIAFAVAPPVDFSRTDVTLDHGFDSDAEMTKSLFAAMAQVKTDYAAIVNAGDMLEPDAIARFTLRAAASGADMIYCDEIAPSAGGPWVRAKPEMSLPRLLESCFIGDWVWYRRAAVAAIGGFDAERYPGAEEQDVQIRMAEAGRQIEHISEALFARGENTRRDSVSLEVATESARASIAAHLARTGTGATVRAGNLPGLFVVEYPAPSDPAVTLGVLCHAPITPEVAQLAVNRLLPHHDGKSSRIVFLRSADATGAMAGFLDKIAAEVTPAHPSVMVIDASPRLGETLDRLMHIRPGNHVALVDPVCAPSEADVLGALCARLDALGDAGAIAPLTFFRDAERTARLRGPLLFGANARLGDGYEASSPGPGGWLATTQPVDAVDGPIVLVRCGASFDPKAASWSEVCASLRAAPGTTGSPRLSAYWTPRRQVEIPDPGQAPSAEVEAARAIPYRGIHHHPAMSLSGSPLLLEGRPGLVGTEAAILITAPGQPEDSAIIGATRFARQHAGLSAGVVAEPVDALSILRARRQGRLWVRVNPKLPVRHPGTGTDIPADVIVWSTLPAEIMRDVLCGAERTVATSPRLATRLRGMGARSVTVAPPRLSRGVWSAFRPGSVKAKPVVLWVEETGIEVPWIDQMIRQTADQVAWTVLSHKSRDMPGNVTQRGVPVFEEDWARVLAETGASILIRPTPGANWCDDYLVALALAGGCRVIAGKESEIGPDIEPLVARTLTSTAVDRWVAALRSLTTSEAGTAPAIDTRDRLLAMPDRWLSPTEAAPDWLMADVRARRSAPDAA